MCKIKEETNAWRELMDRLNVDPDREACKKAEQIINNNDKEMAHYYLDNLLCDVLFENGYEQLVKVFKNTKKWYA